MEGAQEAISKEDLKEIMIQLRSLGWGEEVEDLVQSYLEDPKTFEEESEEDEEKAEFLDDLQQVMSSSEEALALKEKLEKALKKYLTRYPGGEEVFRVALDRKDNRSRKKLELALVNSGIPEEEADYFLKLAKWINMPGYAGVRSILRTFGLDLEGNLVPKYRGDAPLELRKIASLALKLASHPGWIANDGFVRGAVLRISPYSDEPINPRHEMKAKVLQQFLKAAGRSHYSPPEFGDYFIHGEDPVQVFWRGVILTLTEWTDSYQTAIRGGLLHLKAYRHRKQLLWERLYVSRAEDLVQPLLEEGGDILDALDALFLDARTWQDFVLTQAKKKEDKIDFSPYGRLKLDWDQLPHPVMRDRMRVWFFKRLYYKLRERGSLGELAMYLFSFYAYWAEFHKGTRDLSDEFRKIWPEWDRVSQIMEQTWEDVTRYVELLRRYHKHPKIKEYLKDTDLEYLQKGLPPQTENETHRGLVRALAEVVQSESDREFLKEFMNSPYIRCNTYIFTYEGDLNAKRTVYFAKAALGRGTQREWFEALKILREITDEVLKES